jgi:organic radical activating enzyme
VSAAVDAGHLLELFTASQGEGVLTGTPMLFLRLSGCKVGCNFCDTRDSWSFSPIGWLRRKGEGLDEGAEPFQNPVTPGQVLDWAGEFPGPAWVSLTGGEPLEQPDFALALARGLKSRGLKVYLETAGLHPAALEPLKPHLDFISMDWKLPSSSGLPSAETAHRAFLRAMGALPGQVKAVPSSATPPGEVEAAARAVSELRADLPFILQPMTEDPPRTAPLSAAASRWLQDVRVLGQAHRRLTARARPL